MLDSPIDERSGIYCIENLINGKKYIGQAVSLKNRMFEYHKNSHVLNKAIKKYGNENFKRYVVEYCEGKERLSLLETYFIVYFHSHVSEGGYNISWGGISPMIGRNHSKETIEQIRKNTSGEKNHNFGKPKSKETKEKLRQGQLGEKGSNYGKHPSEETKKKYKESRLGICFLSEEDIQKLRDKKGEKNPNYGRHHSEEAKRKIRDNHADESGEKNHEFGKKRKNATSQFFGVFKVIQVKKYIYWRAATRENSKLKPIGQYKTELEAALAYDNYIKEHNLPNPLNFPKEVQNV